MKVAYYIASVFLLTAVLAMAGDISLAYALN